MVSLRMVRTFAVILLLPMLIPLAAIFRLFDKRREISPPEFADLLRRIADDTIGEEWDEFECVPLGDKRLENIRRRAFPFCGRPGVVDKKSLYALAKEAEALLPPTT